MNQAELIGRVLATDQQAQALTRDAKAAEATLEEGIQREIETITAQYEAEAQKTLDELRQKEQAACQEQLQALVTAFSKSWGRWKPCMQPKRINGWTPL